MDKDFFMQFCHFGASVWKRRTSWFLPRLTYKVYVPTLPNYCLLLPRSAAPESSEQMHTVSEAQTSVWLPPARDKYKEERKIQKAPYSPPGSLCQKSLSGLPTSSPHDSHSCGIRYGVQLKAEVVSNRPSLPPA